MKTRQIHTKIWNDDWFCDLSKNSKLLFIYLITNQYVNLIGIYELSDRVILFETGLTKQDLDKSKKDLKDKIIFVDGWIKIMNIEKYDSFKGGKLLSAKEKQLNEIPIDISKKIDRVCIGYQYPIHTPNSNSNSNSNSKKYKYSSFEELKNISDEDIEDLINKYGGNKSFVLSCIDDIGNWIEKKGYSGTYKKPWVNYKAGLANWMKNNVIKIRKEENDKRQSKSSIAYYKD